MNVFVGAISFILLSGCSAEHGLYERSQNVQCRPRFHTEWISTKMSYHTIDLAGRSIVWPEDAPKPDSLIPKSQYQFQFVEVGYREKFLGDNKLSWNPELRRIMERGHILYDASICQVHHVPMKRQTVKISYGLPAFNSPYWKASGESFPNTAYISGGCCVDEDRQYGRTWVCPICAKNEIDWNKNHPSQ